MRALISVYDKNGLDEFCKTLDSLGYEIYSTGGTLDYIKKNWDRCFFYFGYNQS